MLTDNLAHSYSIHAAIKEAQSKKTTEPKPKVSRLGRIVAATLLSTVTFSGAAVATSTTALANPSAATSSASYTQAEREFVAALAADHDTQRANSGLTPFHRDTRLDESAQLWANEMVRNSNAGAGDAAMVHSNTAGTNSPLYFANAAPSGYSMLGENICRQGTTTDTGTQRGHTTFTAFMNSAPHRATILTDRYESIGFAVATDNRGTMFCSVNFGDYYSGGYVAPSAPSAVTNLATTANNDGSVSLTFTAPAETVTGYEVSTDGGNTFAAWNGTSALTGLTVGQSYDIVVRALNSVGAGASSVVSTVVPQQTNIGGNPPVATPPVSAPPVSAPPALGGGGGVSFGGGAGAGTPAPETGTPEKGNTVTTVAGASRYETAVSLAAKTNPAPTQVVIASGENGRLVDSVSAAPFAKSVNAPLLLTTGASLSQEVRDYIAATPSIRGAVIVGGTSAVSEQVMTDLNSLGLVTARLNGYDRYSTSAMLASKTLANTGGSKVFITRGSGSLSDAVSASGTASALGAAVLIVPSSTNALDGWSRSFVENKQVVAVGGTDVLPSDVASAMNAIDRISGASRYETSQAVADYAVRLGVSTDRAFVANGAEGRLVDALTASAAGSVSLLVPADGFGEAATGWLVKNKTSEVIAVGGMTPTR